MNPSENFVIIGLQPWYTSIGSNCKNIARTLAKNHQVLYINSPLDYRTILQQKSNPDIANHLNIIKKKITPIVKIEPNLWVYYPQHFLLSVNWIPFIWLFSKLNYINNIKFSNDIKKAAKLTGFKDFILFNDNEIFRAMYLKELLKPNLYIYYSRDYLLGVDYWKKHGGLIHRPGPRQL